MKTMKTYGIFENIIVKVVKTLKRSTGINLCGVLSVLNYQIYVYNYRLTITDCLLSIPRGVSQRHFAFIIGSFLLL